MLLIPLRRTFSFILTTKESKITFIIQML